MPVSSSRRRTSASGQQTPKRRRSSDSRRFASTSRLSPVESMNSQSLRSTRTATVGVPSVSPSTDRSSGAVPWSNSPKTLTVCRPSPGSAVTLKGAFKSPFSPFRCRRIRVAAPQVVGQEWSGSDVSDAGLGVVGLNLGCPPSRTRYIQPCRSDPPPRRSEEMDGATSTLRERGRGAAHDLASEPLGLLAGLATLGICVAADVLLDHEAAALVGTYVAAPFITALLAGPVATAAIGAAAIAAAVASPAWNMNTEAADQIVHIGVIAVGTCFAVAGSWYR